MLEPQEAAMDLSIKNVPTTLVDQLRRRAKQSHRSPQGELMAVLEQAASPQKPKR